MINVFRTIEYVIIIYFIISLGLLIYFKRINNLSKISQILLKIAIFAEIFALLITGILSVLFASLGGDLMMFYLPLAEMILNGQNPYSSAFANSGPLEYSLFALALLIFNNPRSIAFLFLISYIALVPISYFVLKHIFPEKNGLWYLFGVSLIFNSVLYFHTTIVTFDDDILFTILLFLMLYLKLRSKNNENSRNISYILYIVVLCIASTVKFFSVLIFILFEILDYQDMKTLIKKLLIGFGFIIISFLPFIIIWGINSVIGPLRFMNQIAYPHMLSLSVILDDLFLIYISYIKIIFLVVFASSIGLSVILAIKLKPTNFNFIIITIIALISIYFGQIFLTFWYITWIIPPLSLFSIYLIDKSKNMSLVIGIFIISINILSISGHLFEWYTTNHKTPELWIIILLFNAIMITLYAILIKISRDEENIWLKKYSFGILILIIITGISLFTLISMIETLEQLKLIAFFN